MPHYKDGTEARIGDIIKGKPYNTSHEVIGVVVGITPGAESCNLRVQFTSRGGGEPVAIGQAFGPSDPPRAETRIDYGETKAFELIDGGHVDEKNPRHFAQLAPSA